MKHFLKLATFLLLLSCYPGQHKEGDLRFQFEKLLANPERGYLEEIVEDFDNFLATHYPNETNRFQAYLAEIEAEEDIPIWAPDSLKLSRYKKSLLFNRYQTVYPDSVWFDAGSFYLEYGDSLMSEVELILNREEADKPLNVDSAILAFKAEPEYWLVEHSKFYLALDSIRSLDPLINEYLEAKGLWLDIKMPRYRLAQGLSASLNSNNEYFAKRIYLMDILSSDVVVD